MRCTLFKENLNTMTCVSKLAKLLRAKPNAFSYAGTKDRRAATAQEIVVHGVPVQALPPSLV